MWQAVALTRCVLWRLTHASLYRALEHRPIVYRIICNAVLRRCAASLVTLPLFEFITKDSPQGAARLDVLADLFTCHTLSTSLPEVGAQSRGSPTRARPCTLARRLRWWCRHPAMASLRRAVLTAVLTTGVRSIHVVGELVWSLASRVSGIPSSRTPQEYGQRPKRREPHVCICRECVRRPP